MPEQNYNQLVLAQLQSLSQAMEALRGDLQGVRQEIAELKAKEDKVVELREWNTIFAVVQFAMGAILFAMNFIN
jgi:prefoldin subunit 5